jgi:pimeloyl-ACP methyl ester carboxylesterase
MDGRMDGGARHAARPLDRLAAAYGAYDAEGWQPALKAPVLIVAGNAGVATLEHSVALFRLVGGGDMGKPLRASRLAVLPASSHTAVVCQTELLHAVIAPFLEGETPKGMFE